MWDCEVGNNFCHFSCFFWGGPLIFLFFMFVFVIMVSSLASPIGRWMGLQITSGGAIWIVVELDWIGFLGLDLLWINFIWVSSLINFIKHVPRILGFKT